MSVYIPSLHSSTTQQQQTEIQAEFQTVTLQNGTRVNRITRVTAVIRPENIRPRGAPHAGWAATNPTDLYIFDVLDGIRGRDQRGHLIAGSIGGSGTDRDNIVPMSGELNNGAYKSLESEIAANIRELQQKYPGQKIEAHITIDVDYPSGSTARPSVFRYKVDYKVNNCTVFSAGGIFHNK